MYKATQIGWTSIFIILAVMTLLGFTVKSQSIVIAAIICTLVLLLTYRLTITIDKQFVRFQMGIGLINGKYALKDIADCRPVEYIPLGWGVRLRPGVIIFNVSGNKAVELTIKGKNQKVWIGCDDPEALIRIIREVIRQNRVS